MTRLTVDKLAFAFGANLVIDGASLVCQPGKISVLLGANAAGKTTLLRLISKHLHPQSGAVLLDDADHSTLSRRQLSQTVALMPQHENRDSALTVVEVVSLGRLPSVGWWSSFSAMDHQHVEQAIAATGLEKLRDRHIDELSGGEWRRMILARALAQQASILLLDEPIAGLDLKYQFEVLSHLQRITKENQLTTVVTLHDLNLAALFADTIALMHGGKIIAIGSPRETLTAALIEQAYDIRVTVHANPVHDTPLIIPTLEEPGSVVDKSDR